MFDYGTKVIVLASSHRGGVGAKKGSLAFFNGPNLPHFMINREKNCAFHHINLIFCRYGFEKSFRAERKDVIVLMPLISENYADLSGQVMKLSRRIHSGKETFWNPIRKPCGVNSKTPVVMLAPVGTAGKNLLNCDPTERLAWIESVVRNNSMAHWVGQAMNDKHLHVSNHPALNYDASYMLRDLADDRSSREAQAFTRDEKLLKGTLTTVIAANIIKNRREILGTTDFIRHLIHGDPHFNIRSGDGKFDKNVINSLFYQCFFQPQLTVQLKEMLVREFGKDIKSFFEEPELIRGCLLELSACLARTGKIDGKKAMSVGQ